MIIPRYASPGRLSFWRHPPKGASSNVLLMIALFQIPAVGSAALFNHVPGPSNAAWRTCVAKDEEFSVMMPGTPTLFETSITNPSGPLIPERIYSTYAEGAVYLIVSYNASSVEGTLQHYKAHHLFRGEVTFERDVELDNHKGKQFKLKFGNVFGLLQVFATRSHGYAIATIQAREDAPLREYFFSSLRLIENRGNTSAGPNTTSSAPITEASNLPEAVGQDPLTGETVTRKAVVVSKPEPWFTNEARTANVDGTVVLRVVLSSSGEVTNIHIAH